MYKIGTNVLSTLTTEEGLPEFKVGKIINTINNDGIVEYKIQLENGDIITQTDEYFSVQDEITEQLKPFGIEIE